MCKLFEEIENKGKKEGIALGKKEGKKEGRKLGRKEGKALGKKEATLYSIKQIMKEFAIDIEQAMNVLNIPENEKNDYRKHLLH